ncbi:RNA-binding protein [Methylocella sp.]|uniref:RNA-binding protein n=1 Tax=Methylocella sp. TaxID=1978226 RepID=UPI00378300F4
MDPAGPEEAYDAGEKGPERTCVVTRRKGPPEAMIRFVAGPGDVVAPDLRRKLPGRGVWVMANGALVAEAARRGAFSRGFRRKVAASPDLAAEVDALLERDCLQSLSLANKAGLVVAGFGKAAEAIASGAAAGVVHAKDGAADGARKLGQALRREARRSGDEEGAPASGGENVAPIIELFTSGQLDLSLGRTNVIHAVVLAGPAGRGFVERCRRLEAYRVEACRSERRDAGRRPERDFTQEFGPRPARERAADGSERDEAAQAREE